MVIGRVWPGKHSLCTHIVHIHSTQSTAHRVGQHRGAGQRTLHNRLLMSHHWAKVIGETVYFIHWSRCLLLEQDLKYGCGKIKLQVRKYSSITYLKCISTLIDLLHKPIVMVLRNDAHKQIVHLVVNDGICSSSNYLIFYYYKYHPILQKSSNLSAGKMLPAKSILCQYLVTTYNVVTLPKTDLKAIGILLQTTFW